MFLKFSLKTTFSTMQPCMFVWACMYYAHLFKLFFANLVPPLEIEQMIVMVTDVLTSHYYNQ